MFHISHFLWAKKTVKNLDKLYLISTLQDQIGYYISYLKQQIKQ